MATNVKKDVEQPYTRAKDDGRTTACKIFLSKIFPKFAANITNRKWKNVLKYRFRPHCQRQQRPSTETLLILVLEKNMCFPTHPLWLCN
jgi:hypothetical protein